MRNGNSESFGVSATWLRGVVRCHLANGWVTIAIAEQAFAMIDRAVAWQQLEALAEAMTAPSSTVAPTLHARPLASSAWAVHQHLSTEGNPPARELAADRRARENAAAWGWARGRRIGRRIGTTSRPS
jgi:hypothetical protein